MTITPDAERLTVDLWGCHNLFLRLRSVAAGIRKPNFRVRGERSNRLRHRSGAYRLELYVNEYILLFIETVLITFQT